jgi:cytidine deaminase
MKRERRLSIVNQEPDIESENELFRQNKLALVAKAQSARDQAKRDKTQYRNFYVGCAMLGEDGQIFSGHNIKKEKVDPKLCAERAAMQEAMDHVYKNREAEKNIRIIAVVVVSEETNIDPDTNLPDTTLRPCSSCVAMLNKEPHFSDNTILLTINDKEAGTKGRLEEQITIGELEKNLMIS